MKKLITICSVVVLFSMSYARAGIWTTLDAPGASSTYPYGVDGYHIVGYYYNETDVNHGFVYTIPEPTTFVLLSLGAVMLRRKRENTR
jgi:hypothetical protein